MRDELQEMRRQIEWLGKADTFTVDLMFGPVCDQFRATYLNGQRLCQEVKFYFDYCIPASIRTRDDYDVPDLVAMDTYSAGDFRSYDGESMAYRIESAEWGTHMLDRGYVEIGNTFSGSPYFLHLERGAVRCIRSTAINREGNFRRYLHDPIREEILGFSEETLMELSQCAYPSMQEFFSTLYKNELERIPESIWWSISENEVGHLKRLLELDVDLRQMSIEGISLLEKAHQCANPAIVALLESYFSK